MRTYFAHHQGMSLIALANVLNDGAMRSRFHAEPMVQATELLVAGAHAARRAGCAASRGRSVRSAQVRELIPPVVRRFTHCTNLDPADAPAFQREIRRDADGGGLGIQPLAGHCHYALARGCDTRLLGQLHISARCATRGKSGQRAYQPSGVEPDSYEASFFEDRAEFIRRDRALTTTLEVIVSPEDDAEVRRVSITNLGTRAREIQVTSYAELCLASQAADVAHPAFSNLFVQTEFVPEVDALLATRRSNPTKKRLCGPRTWSVVEGETVGELAIRNGSLAIYRARA